MKWQGGRRFCGREPFERIWCVALVLALAFSVFDLSWMLRSAYFARRAELADEASRTTFSLRKTLFRALDGTEAEAETPEYAQIRTHLQSVARIHPHWETCYLLKKRPDGSVYFLDDIDLNREFEMAEHGEVYADCPPEIAAIFESGRAVVHGPYRDVFGEWITAADPILDPSTGEVLAVLGVDISVSSMRAHLVRGGVVPVAFFASIMLILLVWRGLSTLRKRRGLRLAWLDPAAVALLGLAVSTTLFVSNRTIENSRLKSEFSALASQKSRAVMNAIQTVRGREFESLRRVVQGMGDFDPATFGLLVDQFGSVPEIRFWGWAPEVTEDERPAFEAAESQRIGSAFAIRHHPESPSIEESENPNHYPVMLMRPEMGLRAFGSSTPGLDVSPLLNFGAGLDRVFRSGYATATPLLPAVPGTDIGPHKRVYLTVPSPTRASGVRGYLLGVFEPGHLLKTAMNTTPDRNHQIRLHLVEMTSSAGDTMVLAAHPEARESGSVALPAATEIEPWTIIQPCSGFGNLYYLWMHPDEAFFATYRSNAPLVVFGMGMVVTVLLSLIVHSIGRRQDSLLTLVEERTASLTEAVAMYERMARNSRTIAMRVTAGGVVSEISESILDILGYSPAEAGALSFQALLPASGPGATVMDKVLPPQGVTWAKRHAFLRKDGQVRWFASTFHSGRDRVAGDAFWDVTSTDVTEAHEAEVALMMRERKYRSLVEDMGDVLLEVDAQTLRFAYVSPAIARIGLGLHPADLVGRTLPDVGVFQDEEAVLAELRGVIGDGASGERADEAPVRPVDAVLVGPAGKSLDVEITFRHFRDQASGRGMVGGILRDVSFKKKREKYEHLPMAAMQLLAEPEDFDSLLGRLAQLVKRETGVDAVGIRMNRGRGFPFVASAGYDAAFLATENAISLESESAGEGGRCNLRCFCGLVLSGLAPKGWQRTSYGTAWINDFTDDLAETVRDPSVRACYHSALASMVLAPIRVDGTVIGMLKMDCRTAGAFPEDVIPMIEALGAQIGESFERVEAERSLRESRRQYASLITNMPGMVYRYAVEGGWKLEFMSEGAFDLCGHAADEFLSGGVSYESVVDPAAVKPLWDAWQQLVASGGTRHLEYAIVHKDGTRRWVLDTSAAVQGESGACQAVEGFVFDITERRRAEEARARFAMAMDQSREAVLITDPDGVVEYVNASSAVLTGCSAAETLGSTMPLFALPPADSERYHAMWKALLKGHVWETQMESVRMDGTPFQERVAVSPIRDAAGAIVSFLVIRRDVTQELQDADEREKLRGQVAQMSKMESVGLLAGGIAHDFNNMLQAILGYSEMALMQLGDSHPVQPDILAVRNAARRAAELTQQLLVFARKSKFEPKVIGVPKAISATASLLKRVIGENVAFELALPDLDYCIKVDPSQFDQTLTNLCINARDAIGVRPDGRIALRSLVRETEREIVTPTGILPPGRYAVVSVSDNGSGIPPDQLGRLFEPFFTTKPKGKGTGLGLATVYGTMKASNGGIVVTSAVGSGTTFELYFPLVASEDADAPPRSVNRVQVRVEGGRGEHVLLVDDEETVLATTRRMLESIGYEVLSTSSPLKALDILREKGATIQLLISDVIMPEMTGPVLLQRAREILPGLRCLLISGYTGNILSEHGIAENNQTLVHKPFTRAALAHKIRECLTS